MGKNWTWERRRDYYYRKAKKEGYRSRAAYKLMQINERFRIVRRGDVVVELGSSPGGWTQVIREITGENGFVVAVDIAPMKPIEGVKFIKGDMTESETVSRILEAISQSGHEKANAVVSDMSPNISGNYTWDQARSIDLAEKALDVADLVLANGGAFLVKVFAGMDFQQFLRKVRMRFEFVKVHSPAASRKSSSEVYVVAKRYRGPDMEKGEEKATDL